MFWVAIIGHSNVPKKALPVDRCEIRVFQGQEARAATFDNDSRLHGIYEWSHDLSILFLGSSDITPEYEPRNIVENIKSIVRKLENRCSSKVAVVLIELRVIASRRPDGIAQQDCNCISHPVNRALRRDLKVPFLSFSLPYLLYHLKIMAIF